MITLGRRIVSDVIKTLVFAPMVKKSALVPKHIAEVAAKTSGLTLNPPLISGPLPKKAPSTAIIIPAIATWLGRSPLMSE